MSDAPQGPLASLGIDQVDILIELNNDTMKKLISAEARMLRLEAALRKLELMGENGTPPDYNTWLSFHDKVAIIAREALAPEPKTGDAQ